MAQIIDDLLTLSQFDYSQRPLQLNSLDVSDLVIEVCEQQRSLAKAKDVSLESGDTIPVKIDGNSTRLRQMVRNVLDNAIKYTPSGGKVALELDHLKGKGSRLRISDNGIGIPDAAQPYVFDRFYRVDQARTRKEAGSGLGLSIVKQIVEAHGGTVNVKSDLGVGTTVTLIIPNSSGSGRGPN
jgi:signal transduction histidine kinase